MPFQILADENMPHAASYFSRLGEVRLAAGRAITPELVRDADLLMVRSVTRVNAALLAGSRVRYVGTATIGTDHIDQAWLAAQGIGFAAAPGCNAESVGNWVGAALAFAAGRLGRPLAECSLGVIGAGHTGSRAARIGEALGMKVRLCDPPLARQTGDSRYRPLAELLDCDFLTLHVPLTRAGADPTWRLIDEGIIESLRPGAVILNPSRGGVIDEAALLRRLAAGRLGGTILDAWEGEPAINPALLGRSLLATPHVAGYSYDGKLAGTRMIYEAACRHLGIDPHPVETDTPAPAILRLNLSAAGREFESLAAEAILCAYPIWRDDADLRRSVNRLTPPAARAAVGAAFDALRKHYPLRREFAATRLCLTAAPAEWLDRLRRIGFSIEN
jgi:erythronate-4-phosphate dehydrogenase